MPTSSASSAPGATTTSSHHNNNDNDHSSGPTSSPLLFFVALGFGVVFTNLWIIVGVKYCFRYNQRNRRGQLNENGDPIDLAAMGGRPHRRRREKKLMSMEEVNERFPLIKYKIWRSTREAEGLPAAGGVTAPASRPASLKDESGTLSGDDRQSADSSRQVTAIEIAQHDHANATTTDRPQTPDATTGAAEHEKTLEQLEAERANTTATTTPPQPEPGNRASVVTVDEEDEDDPIRTAAPPEMLAVPGDTCAICLDTLEDDDDVRGLTCGHAFHASCVDPWLTSRRACCPLCKAEYYIPKPRADGTTDEDVTTSGSRRGIRGAPQTPAPVWIGGRAGLVMGRPRLMFAGPRFFLTEQSGRSWHTSTPADQERRRRERDVFYQDPAVQRDQQQQPEGWSWRFRDRVPTFSFPRFGRRTQQPDDAAQNTEATPATLEAGTR